MKHFVIGYISMFDNELKLFFVYAENEVQAVVQWQEADENSDPAWLADIAKCTSLEQLKTKFFDCDQAIDVAEVPWNKPETG